MPTRFRRYLSHRRWARELVEGPEYGLRKPEETIPQAGEQVTVHAVWAVEIYTPLHAIKLFERLEQLGFGRDDPWGRGGIRTRLERVRGGPRGGSWLNLEHVFPPGGSRGFMFEHVEVPLPNGVRVARPSLHALTPSVTALVVQFVLDDDAATAFHRLSCETDFEPKTRIHDSGVSFMPPDQVKETALRDLRADLRARGTRWIAQQIPGVFASGLGGSAMPSAELLTTEVAMPFSRGEGPIDYSAFAGLGYDPFHWVSDELGHWRLAFDRDDAFITVAARRPDAVAAEERYRQHGDDERWPMTYHVNEYLERDLALWSASRLLLACHARLGSIRDHDLQSRRFQSASKRLRTIRDEFLTDATDARLAAAELARFAEDERRFEWNACDWKSSDNLPRATRDRLLENLRLTMQDNAGALVGAEARLRDALIVDSSVVGALASLRLNRWILLITLVALVIAIASLVVASRAGGKDPPNGPPTKSSVLLGQ